MNCYDYNINLLNFDSKKNILIIYINYIRLTYVDENLLI